jgi:hypothetical protein
MHHEAKAQDACLHPPACVAYCLLARILQVGVSRHTGGGNYRPGSILCRLAAAAMLPGMAGF